MKTRNLFPILLMGLTLTFSACSDDDEKKTGETDTYENPFEKYKAEIAAADTKIKLNDDVLDPAIATYVDDVVLPTYAMMLEKITTFNTLVQAMQYGSLSNNQIADICEAWRAARIPWEESEAFLYGPAALKKLDPSLDSWPLDKDGIQQVLEKGDFSHVDDEVDDDDNAPTNAAQNVRGFHTAEYLLFADGSAKAADAFTENAVLFLKVVTRHMLKDTKELYTAWKDGLGSSDADVPTAYGEMMKRHSSTDLYKTAAAAIADIFNTEGGMPAIANEVGEAKIGDPVNEWNAGNKDEAVLKVESWYSWNSLDDYENNIISIQNAYLGKRNNDYSTDATANSFSSVVKSLNPKLDELLRAQIITTRRAIRNIPYPFRSNLDQKAAITKAQKECASLVDGLELAGRKIASAAE